VLADLLPGVPILNDMTVRTFENGHMTARMVDGPHGERPVFRLPLTKRLDLYVIGCMCSPFSLMGQQVGLRAEASKTFFSALKTIVALKPRAVILENVSAMMAPAHRTQVEESLRMLRSYTYRIFTHNSKDFGLPQCRSRLWIVIFREGATKVSTSLALDAVGLNMRQAKHPQPVLPWPEFLASAGVPMPVRPQASLGSQGSLASDRDATASACNGCGERQSIRQSLRCVCSTHPCRCTVCRRHGTKARNCAWRKRTMFLAAKMKRSRMKYLESWRRVKRDRTLKRSPNFWEMAESLRIPMPSAAASSPRVRCDWGVHDRPVATTSWAWG
jgi:site-specific DNA-cytosine methylase